VYIDACYSLHAHTHACIHAYIHTYIHTDIHTNTHTYTQIYTLVRACVHICTQTQIQIYTHTCIQSHMPTYIESIITFINFCTSHINSNITRIKCYRTYTVWRRCTGCLKLQVSFRKRATRCRALSRKMTSKEASYASAPSCINC